MSDYAINTWLDPLIENYLRYFGTTKKPTVWEVGSRDGNDAVEIAKRIYDGDPLWFWMNANITVMECNPDQAKIIRKKWPELEVIQKAASNNTGSAPFMVYEGDEGAVGSSSLNLRWKEDDLPGHQIIVDTEKLDNLVKDQSIDIMKIDTEGHSLEVMEGFVDKFKRVKVFHIETENWTDSAIKMRALMSSHGYLLVDDTQQYGGMPDQVWVRH